MNSVVLNAIVRNEAHVLRRALESARPYVDEYCITDTGSTDGTQDIIKEYGQLHERPWINFGVNRQQALELARETKCNFVLFLDADDVLSGNETSWAGTRTGLSLPGYTLPISYGDTSYTRCSLIRSDAPWRWEAPIHEYLTSDVPLEQGHLDNPTIVIMGGGARSQDPEKFRKDAEVLVEALKTDPTNARYQFYLAQSYRDAGEPWHALNAYRKRITMPGWEEETWFAYYQIGVMEEWGGLSIEAVARSYQLAYLYRPTRAESLYRLARLHRLKNEWALGYLYAKQAVATPKPNDMLFVDNSVYDWRSLEEVALNSYYVKKKDEGRWVLGQLLTEKKAPAEDLKRFEETLNRWFL